MRRGYSKAVQIWLLAGVIMVFGQILIGGITRLTGSGLSITKWEIVTGTLPPMNADQWEAEFDLYKATPQYEKINQGMSMGQFKFIYFWEYFHRLWARSIGFVFLIPFLWFLARGNIDKPLTIKLLGLVAMGAVVATFGWIMVASGLVERPWVNAYKLTLHLNLGILLFCLVLWTYFYGRDPDRKRFSSTGMRTWVIWLGVVLFVQLLLGGVMSGMKAGLFYPTWPDMNGQWIPSLLLSSENWTSDAIAQYDTLPLMPALVQLLHRLTAYVLAIMAAVFVWRAIKLDMPQFARMGVAAFGVATAVQVLLGILTVINCVGRIPLWLGVMHQAGAVVLAATWLYLLWSTARD